MKFALFSLSALCLSLAGAAAAQGVAAGEKTFKKCASCHKVGDGAKNGVGPVLTNVIGRPAGSFEGYKYSKTLIAAGEMGLVWDTENVATYITDPKAFMRSFLDDKKAKPKMTFKLKDEDDRKNVVAYLESFSEAAMVEPELPIDVSPPQIADARTVCVVNASQESYFFAVENADGDRKTATLAFNESLCSKTGTVLAKGTVSVFESENALEGCSRRVSRGTSELMLRYSEFDRCLWSSNQI